MPDPLNDLFSRQDGVITRQQALRYVSDDTIAGRLGKTWRVLLPGIYSMTTDKPTRHQLLRAGLLFGGPTAQLSDVTALQQHQLFDQSIECPVHLLVSSSTQRASRDFVVIRRTTRLPDPDRIGGLPAAPPYRAVCEYILRTPDYWDGLAVASAALQRRRICLDELDSELSAGPAKGRPRLRRVVENLRAGIRSAPEGAFRDLYCTCRSLPQALWNPLIELPGGVRISPDCLVVDAGLVHEVNGRKHHAEAEAGLDAFVDMQRRADIMIAADLRVLSNAPVRIFREGASVISEFTTVYRRERGRGLPAGVRILRPGPPGTPWLPGAR